MTTRILIPAIVVVAMLATCLEGRYHLEETGLRRHRHDRHHQSWDDQDLPEAPRRRDWDAVDRETALDHPHRDRNAVPTGRRNPYERRGAPASYRGRHEPQRKWKSRSEGRHGRDYAPSSWRYDFEDGVKSRRRSERPWTYRKPARYGRRRDVERRWGWYEDEEDDGYEADDENEAYSPSRKPRRNRYDEWRRRVDDEEEYDDYVLDDYEDYDVEETKNRPSRRKHAKRDDYDEEFETGKKNDAVGRRGGKKKDTVHPEVKKPREAAEDLNEVDDDDDDEDDAWDNEEDLDDYDETDTTGVDTVDRKGKSSLKTIDDVIRRLSGRDVTTPKPTLRRDYANIDIDKQAKSSPKLQTPRTGAKKANAATKTPTSTTTTTTTTTTAKPESYAKYTNELSGVTNSSKNEVETVKKKVVKKSTGDGTDAVKPLLTKLTEIEPGVKIKSWEQQDYEDYGSDGADDMDDAENDNDKKEQDYSDDENLDENENDDEIDHRPPTTPLPTTTTTTPAPIFTRSFDRHSRLSDARVGPYTLRNAPTTSTTSTTYPPMSDYSAQKWRNYGNRTVINERRPSRRDDNNEIRQAINHARKMSREAACRWPKPKVIPVHDVYTSPSKLYNPSCTILHRCADDTGCCRPEETCVPKRSHDVELSFYTTELGSHSIVEKLKFVNHTECCCRPRSEIRTTPRPTVPPKPCKCPMNFMAKVSLDGACQCTCPENKIQCIRQRRGKDYFVHADRWCIQSGNCTLPPCEFGEYIKKHGRCPKKMERFDPSFHFSN